MSKRRYVCKNCDYLMAIPFDEARPEHCPKCETGEMTIAEHDLDHIREIGKRKGGGFRRRMRSRQMPVH